jgi:hypothetical protein
MFLDDKALREKLRRIEALHAGAATPGERDAAANAMRHIQQRLKLAEKEAPAVESVPPPEPVQVVEKARPVETKPVETKPVPPEPVETKPVETKPAETKPAPVVATPVPTVAPPAPSPATSGDRLVLRVEALRPVQVSVLLDGVGYPRERSMTAGEVRFWKADDHFVLSASDGGAVRLWVGDRSVGTAGADGVPVRSLRVSGS